MWYPFKFRRQVGYVYLCGDLAELFGSGERRYGRRFRRAIDVATNHDPDFLVAAPGGEWELLGIEGWCTTADRSFAGVTAHFVNRSGTDLWVQTSRGSGGTLRFFDKSPGRGSVLDGASSVVEGRTVDVGYRRAELPLTPPVAGFHPLSELL